MVQKTKDRVVVMPKDVLGRKQIGDMLQRAMPDAEPADFEQFVELVTDGKDAVTVEELLVNAFASMPIPYVVPK